MIAPHENAEYGTMTQKNERMAKASVPKLCAAIAMAVTMAIAILASSCTTTTTYTGSAEECNYALHFVLGKANESTVSKLFFRITQTSSFLPDSLYFITRNADEIPGIRKLLDDWSQSISEYTMDWFEGFKGYVNSLVSDITFLDPERMVHESDESAAEAMESAYGEAILDYVGKTLARADLSKWDDVMAQYDAWVTTQKALYGKENPSLDDVDLVGELSEYICGLYFDELRTAESLLRTTPDPNADPTVSKVFGLD